MEESGEDLPNMIAIDIQRHLSSLTESLTEYFPSLQCKNNYWVQNPFKITEMPTELTAADYESLIETTSDSTLKDNFEERPIAIFWGNLIEQYEKLAKQAMQELLPFVSTYFICESGFSRYAQTKTKYRARLDTTSDIRIQPSAIKLNFSELLQSRKQMHCFH